MFGTVEAFTYVFLRHDANSASDQPHLPLFLRYNSGRTRRTGHCTARRRLPCGSSIPTPRQRCELACTYCNRQQLPRPSTQHPLCKVAAPSRRHSSSSPSTSSVACGPVFRSYLAEILTVHYFGAFGPGNHDSRTFSRISGPILGAKPLKSLDSVGILPHRILTGSPIGRQNHDNNPEDRCTDADPYGRPPRTPPLAAPARTAASCAAPTPPPRPLHSAATGWQLIATNHAPSTGLSPAA